MTNNVYHPGGYISDRYGRPKPRVTLDVAIEDKKLTLGTLRHLLDKAENFADDAQIVITPEHVRVIQESEKPVTTLHHRTGGHLHFETWTAGVDMTEPGTPVKGKTDQPRDSKGRFIKRD